MKRANETAAAAPADSAGHTGSFTAPRDMEGVAEAKQPVLDQDANPKREVGGPNWTLVIAATVLLLFLGLWVGRYMIF